jgi:hypothetical protein
MTLTPTLALRGDGFVDGKYQLSYSIESKGKQLFSNAAAVNCQFGRFNFEVELAEKYPAAELVSWKLVGPNGNAQQGISSLGWSRFHGRVRYRKGGWQSTYIELVPISWSKPGIIEIPVADDGTFDALVPARIYAVLNVSGGGYEYDSMERWGWDYDLSHDREDLFTVGTTEIYGARVFQILGGPSQMLFVFFRPSSIGRIHRFDANGDGIMSDSENRAKYDALKDSPTAIGPELTADDVKISIYGVSLKILRLDLIPEAQGDGRWQVDYLVQCLIPKELEHADLPRTWRPEVKIEVTSHEMLRGQPVTDFGESSVGLP